MSNTQRFIHLRLEPESYDEVWACDTSEEISSAAARLRELGLKAAPVYVGDPDEPDAYKTTEMVYAGSSRT